MIAERRKFIKTLARGILLTGIIGLGSALVLREKPEGAESCDFEFICKNCKKRKSCELPEARSHRAKPTPIS